jgi:hypothetical protein
MSSLRVMGCGSALGVKATGPRDFLQPKQLQILVRFVNDG